MFSNMFRSEKKLADFPYVLTGDGAHAPIQIRSNALPNVVVIATAPNTATILVTENYKREETYKAILNRLQVEGWTNLTVEISSNGQILNNYGGDSENLITGVSNDDSSNTTHFDSIIQSAIDNGASDVRFHVRLESCGITQKIDSKHHHIESLSRKIGENLCAHAYSNLADKSSHEEGKSTYSPLMPQSCVITRKYGDAEYKLRYQSIPEVDGFDVGFRIQAQGERGVVPSLAANGHPPSAIQKLMKAATRKKGMVLATGPVGSGKTTTLYCLLARERHQRTEYALTFEDPPEYKQYGVSRVPVGKTGFIEAMKAGLRLGADIVLVGELRGIEMAKMAQQMQETGQKVFTTTHCNGAHLVIKRLIDFGLNRQEICDTDTLGCFFHQRLIPKLCNHCKRPATPELLGDYYTSQLKRLNIPIEGICVHNEDGCDECKGGFKGRHPVIEILEPDDEYMRLMREERDHDAKLHWLNQCETDLITEDVHGKPIIANALYQAHMGVIGLREIEKHIDNLENYHPTYKPTVLKLHREKGGNDE